MTRTLHVRIDSSSDRSDLEDTLAALDAGETDVVKPKPSTLLVEDLETFGRIFRPTNLELLEAIADHEPESIRELARLVDRHPPEVTQNVNELADYGLVELEQDGRAKRPTIWYDEIDVDIPLGQHSPDVAPA
ncbi:Predicted transcriptional regulator [Halobiforma haloterrestris]|uniref:Predicted transcriptional regulator n=1 Tax=Natronobacterium haloterrestre TaxID=148448 RepID=A0A1I1G9A6_NATHA|nr:helix-turn-helix domain-containing protein [Halobiforma haloterrestris]SFC08289.1 Predicted transcriptional regulator [Halobiforma haloterrestris]